VDDVDFQLARLTVDLFRPVPSAALRVLVEPVRTGRRILTLQASIVADGVEVTRGQALLLHRSDAPVGSESFPPPPGPDGFETNTGLGRRPARRENPTDVEAPHRPFLPGFHTTVETRWVSALGESPPTVWMRIPMPLVEGEETTSAVRAATLSDFGNALANQVGTGERAFGGAYINTDISLYLTRDPIGEWLCLRADHRQEAAGVGLVESVWYDTVGRYARGVQARLANPR
jgi:acyl-CoA thioesterase